MGEAREEQAAQLNASLERQEQASAKRVAELLEQQKEEQKQVRRTTQAGATGLVLP